MLLKRRDGMWWDVVGACITQKRVDARGGKCYLRVVVASLFEFIFYRLQQRASVSCP